MDTTKLDISLAHIAEAYVIANLSREIIEQGLQWSWTPERVGRCILSPDVNVVSAQHQGELIGFGIMFYGSNKAHLNLLGVVPDWRANGVGHCLLQWLEKCAITAGLECCQLELRESNRSARKFYTGHGYSEVERVRGYYQQKENAIRMARSLREGYFQT